MSLPPEWRSTERLSALIQADDKTTRELLVEIGAIYNAKPEKMAAKIRGGSRQIAESS